MKWESFKSRFHHSWHKELKSFIESKECDDIYKYLKANKDYVVTPASRDTFNNFKKANLEQMRCAIIFREPYHDMICDGNPLSCFLGHKVHPMLNMWYDAMEHEYYGLNLEMIKDHTLDYLIKQDVFLHNADLTVFKNKPKSHEGLWQKFTEHILKIIIARNIPVMFIGKDIRDRFNLFPENYPVYCVEQSLHDAQLQWRCNGEFLKMSRYIEEHTDFYDPQWVSHEVPF